MLWGGKTAYGRAMVRSRARAISGVCHKEDKYNLTLAIAITDRGCRRHLVAFLEMFEVFRPSSYGSRHTRRLGGFCCRAWGRRTRNFTNMGKVHQSPYNTFFHLFLVRDNLHAVPQAIPSQAHQVSCEPSTFSKSLDSSSICLLARFMKRA